MVADLHGVTTKCRDLARVQLLFSVLGREAEFEICRTIWRWPPDRSQFVRKMVLELSS